MECHPMVLKHKTETVNGISISYLYLPFLYESNTKGTNFQIRFICFTFVKCACFVLYSTFSVRFDLVKSPEVTDPVWLTGL